jgi:hypothetical protein
LFCNPRKNGCLALVETLGKLTTANLLKLV